MTTPLALLPDAQVTFTAEILPVAPNEWEVNILETIPGDVGRVNQPFTEKVSGPYSVAKNVAMYWLNAYVEYRDKTRHVIEEGALDQWWNDLS